jgi:hypothetical protein
MSSRRILARAAVAVTILVALAGCRPAEAPAETSPPAASTPSATPTAEPAPSPSAAAVPTCDELAGAELLAKIVAADFTLQADWSPTTAENFEVLHPFHNDGGVVCIWGHPAYPEQPTVLAWARLSPENRANLVAMLEEDGSVAAQTADGTVFSHENAFDSGVYGYLVRDDESFYASEDDYLDGLAARADAVTSR